MLSLCAVSCAEMHARNVYRLVSLEEKLKQNMKNYKRINILLGWFTFAVSAVVYLMTTEPSASLWDCGEFIPTSYKLEVGHPPGAPLFMMLARLFTMLQTDMAEAPIMILLIVRPELRL